MKGRKTIKRMGICEGCPGAANVRGWVQKHHLLVVVLTISLFACGTNDEGNQKNGAIVDYDTIIHYATGGFDYINYYANGTIKEVIVFDSEGNINNYVRFNIHQEKFFGYYYKDDDPIEGPPIIHTIWYAYSREYNDSIIVKIDIADPPLLDVRFGVEDEYGIREYSRDELIDVEIVLEDSIGNRVKDTLNCYSYSRIATRNAPSFKFLVVFYSLEGVKLFTFARTIPMINKVD